MLEIKDLSKNVRKTQERKPINLTQWDYKNERNCNILAFTWLKYCRHGAKNNPINQSFSESIKITSSMRNLILVIVSPFNKQMRISWDKSFVNFINEQYIVLNYFSLSKIHVESTLRWFRNDTIGNIVFKVPFAICRSPGFN